MLRDPIAGQGPSTQAQTRALCWGATPRLTAAIYGPSSQESICQDQVSGTQGHHEDANAETHTAQKDVSQDYSALPCTARL